MQQVQYQCNTIQTMYVTFGLLLYNTVAATSFRKQDCKCAPTTLDQASDVFIGNRTSGNGDLLISNIG